MLRRGMEARQFNFIKREACPACRSENVTTRFRSSFDGPPIGDFISKYYKVSPALLSRGVYRLDQCRRCATIYQAEVGDRELLMTIYVDWVLHTDQPEADANYAYDMAYPKKSRDGHEIMAAAAYLNMAVEDLRTLDYGMGWAGWGRVAAALGSQSFGSDIAPDRMAFAKANGVTPLRDEEIGEDRFHFINTEQVMEHMTEPAEVTQRLALALRPGGILKMSVPSQGRTEELLGRIEKGQYRVSYDEVMPIQPLEHVNSFTIAGLVAMGRRFGLTLVKPKLIDRYAFLKVSGGLDFTNPRRLAKELVRPWYQYRNPRNLYVWLRRPVLGRGDG